MHAYMHVQHAGRRLAYKQVRCTARRPCIVRLGIEFALYHTEPCKPHPQSMVMCFIYKQEKTQT